MQVADLERLSRFIFFSKWYARTTRRVKPDAFIPHPYIELSVSCTDGLSDEVVWNIGNDTATSRRDNPALHGRADLKTKVIRQQALDVVRDDNPLYHANIVGWGGERSAQISKAQQILLQVSCYSQEKRQQQL